MFCCLLLDFFWVKWKIVVPFFVYWLVNSFTFFFFSWLSPGLQDVSLTDCSLIKTLLLSLCFCTAYIWTSVWFLMTLTGSGIIFVHISCLNPSHRNCYSLKFLIITFITALVQCHLCLEMLQVDVPTAEYGSFLVSPWDYHLFNNKDVCIPCAMTSGAQ